MSFHLKLPSLVKLASVTPSSWFADLGKELKRIKRGNANFSASDLKDIGEAYEMFYAGMEVSDNVSKIVALYILYARHYRPSDVDPRSMEDAKEFTLWVNTEGRRSRILKKKIDLRYVGQTGDML